jgi:hypothetical protein
MTLGRYVLGPLGSMLKDTHKNVANWLVKLLGSVPALIVARGGVISIGCAIKGNCRRVSKPKSPASGWA